MIFPNLDTSVFMTKKQWRRKHQGHKKIEWLTNDESIFAKIIYCQKCEETFLEEVEKR